MDGSKLLILLLGLVTITFGFVAYSNLNGNRAEPLTGNSQITTIELETADGTTFLAHQAGPENADAAILVVHDWFGISDFSYESLEHLGSLGYFTLAIDLYNGESAQDHQKAFNLLNSLNIDEVLTKLNAAVAYIERPNRKIASLGFSMGSKLAFEATLHNPEIVDASILVYGDMERDPARLEVLKSPVLAITGSRDNPGQLTDLLTQLEGINKSAEIYIYPGALHAYAQPLFNQGANYDATATRITWMLIEDFLERHLR